jgi:hypothetical protein
VVFTDDASLAPQHDHWWIRLDGAHPSTPTAADGVMNIIPQHRATREIGIRKALGAPQKAIMTQFLV